MGSKDQTFEELLKRLEDIVEKMEGGGLSLEESMKLYEEGMKKTELLGAKLAEVREKVMKLVTNSSGSVTLEPFDEEKTV